MKFVRRYLESHHSIFVSAGSNRYNVVERIIATDSKCSDFALIKIAGRFEDSISPISFTNNNNCYSNGLRGYTTGFDDQEHAFYKIDQQINSRVQNCIAPRSSHIDDIKIEDKQIEDRGLVGNLVGNLLGGGSSTNGNGDGSCNGNGGGSENGNNNGGQNGNGVYVGVLSNNQGGLLKKAMNIEKIGRIIRDKGLLSILNSDGQQQNGNNDGNHNGNGGGTMNGNNNGSHNGNGVDVSILSDNQGGLLKNKQPVNGGLEPRTGRIESGIDLEEIRDAEPAKADAEVENGVAEFQKRLLGDIFGSDVSTSNPTLELRGSNQNYESEAENMLRNDAELRDRGLLDVVDGLLGGGGGGGNNGNSNGNNNGNGGGQNNGNDNGNQNGNHQINNLKDLKRAEFDDIMDEVGKHGALDVVNNILSGYHHGHHGMHGKQQVAIDARNYNMEGLLDVDNKKLDNRALLGSLLGGGAETNGNNDGNNNGNGGGRANGNNNGSNNGNGISLGVLSNNQGGLLGGLLKSSKLGANDYNLQYRSSGSTCDRFTSSKIIDNSCTNPHLLPGSMLVILNNKGKEVVLGMITQDMDKSNQKNVIFTNTNDDVQRWIASNSIAINVESCDCSR